MKVTVQANANIALTKYWGWRNPVTRTPYNSSTSITLAGMETTTTLELDKKFKEDILVLDGKKCPPTSSEYLEMKQQLDHTRKALRITDHAKIHSKNNFPTAAGFASSASGFAALNFALVKAARSDVSMRELTMLTRYVSGSATRSLISGFAIWHAGTQENGSDSFAEQIMPPEHWPEFRILGCITSKKAKKVKSRAGMEQSVKTSPIFMQWTMQAEKDAQAMCQHIIKKNFEELGKLAQRNCLLMHACMLTTDPALVYWNGGTLDVMHAVMEMQDTGEKVYFTMDAGPQVKIICLKKDVAKVKKKIGALSSVQGIIECKPGLGPRVISKHLF